MGTSQVQKPFLVPCFLFVGKRLSLLDFPWVPKGRFKHLLIREGRECRKEEQSRNNSAAIKQGPGSSWRDIHNNYLWVLLLQALRSPPRWKMIAACWAEDSWSTTVTSPPTNKKEVTHPAALTLSFACKNTSLKTIREFGFFQAWATCCPCLVMQ